MEEKQLSSPMWDNKMDSPESGGRSLMPPVFGLQNGSEAPPDAPGKGGNGDENQLEEDSPDYMAEMLDCVEEKDLPALEAATGANEEKEDEEEDEEVAESELEELNEETSGESECDSESPNEENPVQMVVDPNRPWAQPDVAFTSKTKDNYPFTLTAKNIKQAKFIRALENTNVGSAGALATIIKYCENVPHGSHTPSQIVGKHNAGKILAKKRFVDSKKRKKIVDQEAKYKQAQFRYGKLKSRAGKKGHEIKVPLSKLTQAVKGQIKYSSKDGNSIVTIRALSNGKLEKKWSPMGKHSTKILDLKGGVFIKYLARKRRERKKQKQLKTISKEQKKRLNQQMIVLSEMIGEKGVEMVTRQFFPEMKLMDFHNHGGKQGEFDLGGKDINNNYNVIESKGGSSTLGTRKNPDGKGQVRQGSKLYTKAIINQYQNDPNPLMQNLGNNLKNAQKNNKLRYFHSKLGFDQNDEPQDIVMKEFADIN